MKGEIRCRSVGVDVSDAAGDQSRTASDIPDRRLRHRLNRVMQALEAIPGDRALEGIADDGARHHALAAVGHADKGIAPTSSGAFAMGARALARLRHATAVAAAFE